MKNITRVDRLVLERLQAIGAKATVVAASFAWNEYWIVVDENINIGNVPLLRHAEWLSERLDREYHEASIRG